MANTSLSLNSSSARPRRRRLPGVLTSDKSNVLVVVSDAVSGSIAPYISTLLVFARRVSPARQTQSAYCSLAAGAWVSTGHARHVLLPIVFLKVSAAHATHAPGSPEYPAAHTHPAAPGSDHSPSVHAAHNSDPRALLKNPAPHGSQ